MNTDKNNLRLAVLIDAENLNPSIYKTILNETKKYGELSIKRIYGNLNNLKSWKTVIDENAFKSFYIANTKSKNGSDIAMVVDAMDLLLNQNIDGFCIVSSDSDFTHLAIRIRESDKFILGFGEEKSLPVLRSACNDFIVLKNDSSKQSAKDKQSTPAEKLNDEQKVVSQVKKAISELPKKEDEWIYLNALVIHFRDQPNSTGYAKSKHGHISKFLKKFDKEFELNETNQKVRLKNK